jgi:rare lipoprotein A
VKGRVIDLSRSAARKLGMIKPGLAKVRVEQIVEDVPNAPSSESDAYKGDF